MHNILANERLKLRRNKLLPVCTLIAILIPVFMVAVDLVEKYSLAMTGILNLLAMSPLLIVCILQRNIFYPSLLCSCLISGLGFVGLY